MVRTLNCDCGFAARAADEDGLIAEVRRHAWEAHAMPLTRDQALALVSLGSRGGGATVLRDGREDE